MSTSSIKCSEVTNNGYIYEPTIKIIYLENIVKNISKKLVLDIRDRFLKESSNGNVTEKQLQAVLQPYNLNLSDKDFRPMFAKIDQKKEGAVNFMQFIMYLSTEFELYRKQFDYNDETFGNSVLIVETPLKIVNKHRRSIIGIELKPLLGQDAVQTEFIDGEYITASNEGVVHFWTLDMKWKRGEVAPARNNELTTKLTALVVLPDLNIVGVASVECELRFYDTLASQFRLRLVIDKMPHMVTCLSYIYEPGANLREYSSKLLFGDCIGGVRILSMMTRGRGPFRMNTGDSYVVHNYADLMTLGGLGVSSKTTASAPFNVLEFPNLHPYYVQQVMFCNGGKAMVSVSETYNRSMMYCQTIKNGWWRSFTAPQGFSCACIIENTHLVAGSQDCVVRVWSIDSFLGTSATTKQRSINFTGHNAPIMHVFYNNRNRRLYSMCFERIIKVWSVHKGACLVTYTGLTTLNADYQELCIYFNQKNSTLIVGGRTIVVLPCSENINHTLSDGYSHNAAVTKTMYNKLYRLLISVSADAVITVWNPWTGEMILKRTNAHTKLVLGEFVPAEITAANFDPSGGLLVTGSEDGSIRIWDPTNGACLNRLQIASKCQISELIWLPNKVLVSSWDKRITEFNHPLLVSKGKRWLVSHEESILTMSVKLPSMLVTTSYAGKVGFWRLETGQMIKFYGLKMKPDSRGSLRGYGTNKNQISSMNLSSIQTQDSHFVKGTNSSGLFETRKTKLQKLGVKFTPKEYRAATSSHFLRGRQDATRVGNLLIATRNGVIQIWSTFKIPTYLAQFKAIHIEGDYVTSMASDDKSHYLFTCFTTGYVKIWFIINFGVVNKQAISMPLLRLRFSFLINSFFVGRAERAARNEQNIILVSSYQAHLGCIRHIEYVQHVKMVVTSSVDMSIRLWTINGHYIGTLGSPKQWPRTELSKTISVYNYRLPPDIKRVASSTTLQVLMNGVNSVYRSTKAWERLRVLKQQRDMEDKEVKRSLLGDRCPENPLYKHYCQPDRPKTIIDPTQQVHIDMSVPRIEIYKYLSLYELKPIPQNQISKDLYESNKPKKVRFKNV